MAIKTIGKIGKLEEIASAEKVVLEGLQPSQIYLRNYGGCEQGSCEGIGSDYGGGCDRGGTCDSSD